MALVLLTALSCNTTLDEKARESSDSDLQHIEVEREQKRGTERQPELRFVEKVLASPESDRPLPLIVGLHGLGDTPENFVKQFRKIDLPARLIIPQGNRKAGQGFGWMPARGNDTRTIADIRRSAHQVAELIEHITSVRRTQGKPILVGYSQGGVLAYILAAHHPERLSTVIPINGLLPPELYPTGLVEGPLPIVRAFHGQDDPVTFVIHSRRTVVKLRRLGFDARVRVYPQVGHWLSPKMHDDLGFLLKTFVERAKNGQDGSLIDEPRPCPQCPGESADPDSCMICDSR